MDKNINEPCIIINGKTLTKGEVMTVHVAIESFASTLEGGLGEDELGKQITEGYKNNIKNIRKKYLNREI